MARKKKNAAAAAAANVQAVPVEEAVAAATATATAATAESKKNATAKKEVKGDDDELEEGEEEELELLQIELGDVFKVKQVLDEAVANTLLEYGLPEDYRWDNVKLILMFVACTFAVVAQFAPLEPFSDEKSRMILGACICLYFVLSGILTFLALIIDQDSILWTLPLNQAPPMEDDDDDDEDEKKKLKDFHNEDLQTEGLQVRTCLPRFSEFYTVTIQFHANDKSKANRSVSQQWSIGQFFDKDGYFDEDGMNLEMDKLFDKFDQKQYDNDKDDKKDKKD